MSVIARRSRARAKLFHQIERERWRFGRSTCRKPTNGSNQPRERRDAIVSHQRVEKRKQAIDAIPGRTTSPAGEGKVVLLLFEHEGEDGEVDAGRHPSAPRKWSSWGCASEISTFASRGSDGPALQSPVQASPDLQPHRFHAPPQQTIPAVLNFPGDDLAGDGRALRAIIGGAELGSSQRDTRVRHPGHAGLEMAKQTQVIHRHAVFPTQVEGRRADGCRAKGADRLQMMNGMETLRQSLALSRVRSSGASPRDTPALPLQGEMIARDIRAGRVR